MSSKSFTEKNAFSENLIGSSSHKDRIDPWLKVGVIFGLLLIIIYVLTCFLIYHCAPSLTHAVTILLSSCGISVGLKLIYITIRSNYIPELDKDRIYLAVGGISTIWVSISALYSVFTSF